MTELAEVISLIVSFMCVVIFILAWKEVWSPLRLRNDDARGHVVGGNVNNLVVAVA